MMKLFTNPGEAFKEIKKVKGLGKAIGVLAIAAIIFAIVGVIGATAIFKVVPTLPMTAGAGAGIAAVITFLVIFIGGLFFAWLLQLTMNTLGCKGDFNAGLVPVAYPLLILSVGTLVSALLAYIPMVGGILAFLVTIILTVMAFALTYRAIKEMFATDMITAFIGLLVLWGAAIAAGVYAGAIGMIGTVGKIPFLAWFGL
jgi:hypothetical protein